MVQTIDRLQLYIEGFFPPYYAIEYQLDEESDSSAPLVTIIADSPFRNKSAQHYAYLHEILDISYMSNTAKYLLKVIRADVDAKQRES